MSFLYFLETLRNPVCDAIFSVLTYLGGEGAFLVFVVVLFWCVNKREAYYVMCTCCFGTLFNQSAKLLCRVPRPWVRDPSFTIVESARRGATGYSFPSGHSQNIGAVGASVAFFTRRRAVRIVCTVLIIGVCFSRMYLGVHTPADVLVGCGTSILLALVLRPVFVDSQKFKRCLPWLLFGAYIGTIALILFTILYKGATDSPENLLHARQTAFSLHGALLGFLVSWMLDSDPDAQPLAAPLPVQIFKCVLGLIVLFALRSYLKVPLRFLCFGNEDVARVVRYFLMSSFAGAIYPRTFPWIHRFFASKTKRKNS